LPVRTLGEWLTKKPPAASANLDQRLAGLLSPHHDEDLSTGAESCIYAAASILGRLVAERQTGRSEPAESRRIALDLLTADALITIACELAAADYDRLDERTARWANRIASLTTAVQNARTHLA
jgi:hypothetical protein